MLPRLLLLGALLIAGCAARPHPAAPEALPHSGPANSQTQVDDPEMNEAIAKARQTLPSFINRLNHPQRGEVFSIKAPFTAPDGTVENLWIGDVSYKDGIFQGTLTSKSTKVLSPKYGEATKVKSADVTDWMILRSGASEGGYTEEVMLKHQAQPK